MSKKKTKAAEAVEYKNPFENGKQQETAGAADAARWAALHKCRELIATAVGESLGVLESEPLGREFARLGVPSLGEEWATLTEDLVIMLDGILEAHGIDPNKRQRL